ncbi:MAG: sulfite exporter TauE/SafE family protein [Anaerolineaceae bacterium]|nr:sulfite exporter TauE/SafE family protein [Anaerolineaceae bacterium]
MITLEIEALIGLATGLIVGITGASGVLLVVPALTIFLGYPMHTAVGTSLFVDIITPLFVAITYYRHGNVNLKTAFWLALGAILGAQGGALIANLAVPNELMGKGFVVFLFLMAISMWLKNKRPARDNSNVKLAAMNAKNRLITFGIGLALGIISGLFGAGGGLMFLLVLLVVLKYPLRMAVGTSSLIMAMTAASGTLGYGLQGNVDYATGIIISIAAVLSGMLSARLANRVPDVILNRIAGSVFAVLGIVMMILK